MESTDETDSSRFEGVLVRRFNREKGSYEYLALDYEPIIAENVYGKRQVKYPGGRSLPGERKGDTAVRELEEETGLVIRPRNRRHLEFLYKSPEGQFPQLFFLIDRKHCGGKLKTEVMIDRNSRLSNRRWVPGDELYGKLFDTHLQPHKVAVIQPRPELALAG